MLYDRLQLQFKWVRSEFPLPFDMSGLLLATGVALSAFLFFSSRRRHTILQGDWSSDVCSSDLIITFNEADRIEACLRSVAFCDETIVVDAHSTDGTRELAAALGARVIERDWPGYRSRSEERRVGKECRSRWSPYH